MGSKAEVFMDAKQIRTNIPILCVGCMKERILNWSDDYVMWLCDKCLSTLPANKKTLKFKRAKARLYNRKISLQKNGVDKWVEKNTN